MAARRRPASRRPTLPDFDAPPAARRGRRRRGSGGPKLIAAALVVATLWVSGFRVDIDWPFAEPVIEPAVDLVHSGVSATGDGMASAVGWLGSLRNRNSSNDEETTTP